MEQEFKIKRGWRIFGYTFFVIVIIITLYFLVNAVLFGNNVVVWMIINFVSISLFGYLLAAMYRGKIVLTDDSIVEYNVFGTRQLLFSEVKGYRTQGQKIILLSSKNKRSWMVVGDFDYTINGSALATFLTSKFKDLDESDYNTEVSEALNDPAIGGSVAEREQRIKLAKKIVRFLNIGGFVIMASLILSCSANYHMLIIVLGLLYPLIVLTYFLAQQQIVTLVETGKPSVHPNLTIALLFPVAGLSGRLLLQYCALNPVDCILPVALLALVLMLLFILFLRKSNTRQSNLWIGLFFCLVYSASAIGIINCEFDYSLPAQYRAKVLDHWTLHGPTSYNLKLDAWALQKKPSVESVPRSTYDKIRNGGRVTVYVKKGYLGISWYFVE